MLGNTCIMPQIPNVLQRYFTFALMLFCWCASAQTNSLFNRQRLNSLAQRWELDSLSQPATFVVTPYKPVYILPLRWSSSPNGQPRSGNSNPDYTVTDNLNLNNLEAKFQISFKVKVAQGLFWGNGDLWGAYSQKAHWQVYNASLSRPFREINYEPEAILNFTTHYSLFGFKGRMAGISINHQSNGRSYPLSRSWNRIIAHAAFEKDDWQVFVRAWYRVPDDIDDNPNISRYIGYGDATVTYATDKDIFSATVAPNFSFNKNMKGSIELNWARSIKGNLKFHAQFFHGYGETLIDYNQLQTIVGVGISLVEWM